MKIYEKDGAVCLRVYIQPRASRSEIVAAHGDSLKIRVAAPPVEGEANTELERYLGRLTGVAASNVAVIAGASSRHKTVAIEGSSLAIVKNAIERALKSAL